MTFTEVINVEYVPIQILICSSHQTPSIKNRNSDRKNKL